MTAKVAAAPVCIDCARPKVLRRGLCTTCYMRRLGGGRFRRLEPGDERILPPRVRPAGRKALAAAFRCECGAEKEAHLKACEACLTRRRGFALGARR